MRVRPAGGPGGSDGQPDRAGGGARRGDRGRGRRAAAGRGRVQRGRLPGHAGAAGLAGGTAGRAGRTAGPGAAAAGLRGETGCRRRPRDRPDQVGAAGRRFRGNVRGPGAGAAGRPDRLAPARGQAGLVAVLLPPHAEPGGTDRRAGRAGRARRRRGGRPGQEVGGAAVPFPGAGTQVLRGRHGLRSGHGQAVAGLRRGRRARDDRPEGGQHLRRAVARGPDRGRAAQDLGAAGSAAGSR